MLLLAVAEIVVDLTLLSLLLLLVAELVVADVVLVVDADVAELVELAIGIALCTFSYGEWRCCFSSATRFASSCCCVFCSCTRCESMKTLGIPGSVRDPPFAADIVLIN